MVYGGELAFSRADLAFATFPDEDLDKIVDLKGRIGYASGPILLYGVLGWSQATYDKNTDFPNNNLDLDGLLLGIGLDYMVTDRIFLGGEVSRRRYDGSLDIPDVGRTTEHNVTLIQVRAGFRF